jgi:glucose dehydrogenase
MHPWKALDGGMRLTMPLMHWRWNRPGYGAACWAVVACLTLAVGGCASINTPLPDLTKRTATPASVAQERKKEMDDLNRARDTHEQDAEKQIESAK